MRRDVDMETLALLGYILGALLLGAFLGWWLSPSRGMLPPCPHEDSTGCYWDAETRGNGLGHDVVSPTNAGREGAAS